MAKDFASWSSVVQRWVQAFACVYTWCLFSAPCLYMMQVEPLQCSLSNFKHASLVQKLLPVYSLIFLILSCKLLRHQKSPTTSKSSRTRMANKGKFVGKWNVLMHFPMCIQVASLSDWSVNLWISVSAISPLYMVVENKTWYHTLPCLLLIYGFFVSAVSPLYLA